MVPKVISIVLLMACHVMGANFQCWQSGDYETAKKIANRAEQCYAEIALAWFGREMPPLPSKCDITYDLTPRGSSGLTSWDSGPAGISNIKMHVSGPLDRLMNDTIPHETMHLVLRQGLGYEIPRWMDEGACSTAESDNYVTMMENMLIGFLRKRRVPPINTIFLLQEYPPDVMPFYAASCSLSRFLVGVGGKEKFLDLARSYRLNRSWSLCFKELYGYESLAHLQDSWMQWVSAGFPDELTRYAAKPIPVSQAPYRPSRVLTREQCDTGQCFIQPQRTAVITPYRQQVTPTQGGQKGEKGDKGDPGPVGPAGPKGDPGEVSEEDLQRVVQAVVEELRSDPELQGPPGVPGPPGPPATEEQLGQVVSEVSSIIMSDPSMRGPKGDPPSQEDIDWAVASYFEANKDKLTISLALVNEDGVEIDRDTVPIGGTLKLQLQSQD